MPRYNVYVGGRLVDAMYGVTPEEVLFKYIHKQLTMHEVISGPHKLEDATHLRKQWKFPEARIVVSDVRNAEPEAWLKLAQSEGKS